MTIHDHPKNIIIVELPPEPELRAELDRVMQVLQAGCYNDVIMDLSKVNIMTSLALSGFLKVREIISEAGRRLIFCNTSPITKDIFKVTCFDGIFEFIDDIDEAIESLSKSESCSNR